MSSLSPVPDSSSDASFRDAPPAAVRRPIKGSKLNVIIIGIGVLALTAGVIFTVLHLLDQSDKNRMTQVAVLQVEALSRIVLVAAALFSTTMLLIYFRRFRIERHRANVALEECAVARKNEDRFRTLTEKSADLILITTAEGDITYISPSVRSVLGWSDRAVIGTSLFERIHSDDVGLARVVLDAAPQVGGRGAGGGARLCAA